MQLTELDLAGNPLEFLVISQPLAANLSGTIATLENVLVSTYPLAIHLSREEQFDGAFRFAISGPPGVYLVLISTNFPQWTVQGTVDNPLGGTFFIDETTQLSPQKFYRVQLQTAPTP